MDYQKYFQTLQTFWQNLSLWKRFFVYFLVLIFLGVGIFLYNPAKKMLEMRNSQRRSDVVNILNAVYQYRSDKSGELPHNISSEPTMICRTGASSCDGLVDFSKIVLDEKKLLSEVPVDPREKDQNLSGYQIYISGNGRLNVKAPLAENNAVINLSK